MAIDPIDANEDEVARLNVSIEERRKLMKEEKLDDEQLKQLLLDVGRRWLLLEDISEMTADRQRREDAVQN